MTQFSGVKSQRTLRSRNRWKLLRLLENFRWKKLLWIQSQYRDSANWKTKPNHGIVPDFLFLMWSLNLVHVSVTVYFLWHNVPRIYPQSRQKSIWIYSPPSCELYQPYFLIKHPTQICLKAISNTWNIFVHLSHQCF